MLALAWGHCGEERRAGAGHRSTARSAPDLFPGAMYEA